MSNIDIQLKAFWDPTVERCGFILKNQTIVEVPNSHPQPTLAFHINQSGFKKYAEEIAATWHSHPTTGPNLSVPDYFGFLSYPDLYHYIIAKEKIWCYYVENGVVLKYENN